MSGYQHNNRPRYFNNNRGGRNSTKLFFCYDLILLTLLKYHMFESNFNNLQKLFASHLQEIASIEASKIVIFATIEIAGTTITGTMDGIIVVIVIAIGDPDLEATLDHGAHTIAVKTAIRHKSHHLHHHRKIHKRLMLPQHQTKTNKQIIHYELQIVSICEFKAFIL